MKIEYISEEETKSIVGTFYIGSMRVRFDELVRVFGLPNRGESPDQKTSVQWFITINKIPITIYDWKNTKNVLLIEKWNVGGYKKEDFKLVEKALEEHNVKILDKYPI